MKHGERALVCTLAAFAMCTAANAITGTGDASGSPYQSVVERNVFGLKPPPPPPDPEANKPPPPKMFLQGITTFGGTKRALLKTQMPAKPGEPPKGEQSFVLAEGQREGDIEVLEIDAKGGTVKVNDFGTIATLDFEHNGIKTATAPPVAGAVPHPVGGLPTPGANPFTPAGGAQPPSITRPMRLPRQAGASASFESGGATPAYASGTTAYGGGTPSLGLGGASVPLYGSTPVQTQPQQPALSGEEQAAMMAAQILANKDRRLPPPPPPVAQLLDQSDNSGPPTPPVRSVPQLPRPGQPLPPPPF